MYDVRIYYRDQINESDRISNIVDIANEKGIGTTTSKASIGLSFYDLEFPIVEINSRLFGYKDGLERIKEC